MQASSNHSNIMSAVFLFMLLTSLSAQGQEPAATPEESAPPSSSPGIHSNLSSVAIGAALDLYAPLPLQNSEGDQERFRVRSGQVFFEAELDPVFDALLNIGGRDVNGDIEITVHEGYLSSAKLIPQSRIKLGKFLLGVGKLNQIRQNDWPYPSASKSHRLFFSDSNAIDTGIEYAWVPESSFFELSVGVTNGYSYGYSTSNSGQKPLTPTHYLHPAFFVDVESGGRLKSGLTYLGRNSADGTVVRLAGFDASYSLMEGSWLKWLLQTEFYHRYTQVFGLPIVEEIGGYLYAQRGLNEKWAAGLRFDAFTTPSLRTFEGDKRDNMDLALVPVVAYKPSESSTVRLAYTYFRETKSGNSDRTVQLLELQLIAELGSMPAYRN